MRGAALLLALVSAASCTLLGSRDVVQCDVDADCPDMRPICAAHLCTPRTALTDAGSDADAPSLPKCSTTADCEQSEGKFLCVDRVCRHLDTSDCPIVLPPDDTYRQDGVTLVGVYLEDPGTGPSRAVVEYALDEINHGIYPPRISAILCKKTAPLGADTARTVIEHLASLRVPVVVGDFEASELTAVGQMPDLRHIAVWSTLGNDSSVQPIGSTYGNRAFLIDELESLAPTFQPVLDHALERAEELNGGPIPEPQVVIVGSSKKAEVRAIVRKLQANLRVKDKIGNIESFSVQSNFEPQPAAVGELFLTGAEVAARAPHVAIAIGGSEIVNEIVPDFEAHAGGVRTVWVLSPRGKLDVSGLNVTQALQPNTKFFARVLGVDFSGDAKVRQDFEDGARARMNNALVGSFDTLYDAMYVTAIASKLAERGRDAGAGPLSDQDFLRGLLMLSDADAGASSFGTGETELDGAENEIHLGNPISYRGPTGVWHMDPKTHSRRMGGSMFCMKPNTNEIRYYLDPAAPLAGNCQAP